MKELMFNKIGNRLTYLSLLFFALFVYTSTSGMALIHIFIFLPALYFFVRYIREKDLQWSLSNWALLGMIVMGIISIVCAPDISAKFKNTFKLKYFVLGLLAIYAYRYAFDGHISKRQIKILLWIFCIAVIMANINGIIGMLTNYSPLRFRPQTEPGRSTGMFGMSMTYGYSIQFVVLIFAGLLLYKNELENFLSRRLIFLVWITSFIGMYLSYCRGALVGFLVGFPFLLYQKSRKLCFTLLATMVLFISVFAIYTSCNDMTGRSSRIFKPLDLKTNNDRVALYQAAWYAFKERPWTGLGFRNFEPHSSRIKKKHGLADADFSGHAHNNFGEFLAGTGFLGFLFLLLFHIFWFVEAFKRKDILGQTIPAVVIGFFASGQFQSTITDAEVMFLIMLLYGFSQIRNFRLKGS